MKKLLDFKDKKIINLLKTNARISFVEIAAQINCSESSIRQRIKKMEKKGIIQGYTIKINPIIFGYSITAFFGINTHPGKLLKIVSTLKGFDEIESPITTSGDYMIICKVYGLNGEHIARLQEEIESIDGVMEVLPSLGQEEY